MILPAEKSTLKTQAAERAIGNVMQEHENKSAP